MIHIFGTKVIFLFQTGKDSIYKLYFIAYFYRIRYIYFNVMIKMSIFLLLYGVIFFKINFPYTMTFYFLIH